MSETKLFFRDTGDDGNFYFTELNDADFRGLKIENGKILRDQFAAAALTGILCSRQAERNGHSMLEISNESFMYADAMMKARSRK